MPSEDEQLIERALRAASHTRLLRVEHNVLQQVAPAFQQLFGSKRAGIVADANTFAVAGKTVYDNFRRAGIRCLEPHVFTEPALHAEYEHVETLQRSLAASDTIPVAVGSGTINDLVKLAASHLSRPYLAVATAASMDGYLAFGASITLSGSKQTMDCAAPVGVLADLNVIEAAPQGMNAAGYADLLAKVVAGADWIVADALAVESIEPGGWEMMHSRLGAWIDDPDDIRRGNPQAIRRLVLGLLMSGIAMQWTKSSRVASGAEHQFSHLWDMQGHVHQGATPSHGFKVGIGTLASSALYEQILPQTLQELDIEQLLATWPDLPTVASTIKAQFDSPDLIARSLEETTAKYVSAADLRRQLETLRSVWPQLRVRLQSQLLPFDELAHRLRSAGCPAAPQQIGIPPSRLRESYRQAYYLRRRFTVLDLAQQTQLLESALATIFGPRGRWPIADAHARVAAQQQQ